MLVRFGSNRTLNHALNDRSDCCLTGQVSGSSVQLPCFLVVLPNLMHRRLAKTKWSLNRPGESGSQNRYIPEGLSSSFDSSVEHKAGINKDVHQGHSGRSVLADLAGETEAASARNFDGYRVMATIPMAFSECRFEAVNF